MAVDRAWVLNSWDRMMIPKPFSRVLMRFGKLIAVFQPNPADAKSTITTVVIALAVGSSTLEQKKKYENVPVLRNLVPSQVLLGNSSFNVGNSISAGLPSYVRNRIKAIAGILDRG